MRTKTRLWSILAFLLGAILHPLNAQSGELANPVPKNTDSFTLCIDVGNTDVLCGIYCNRALKGTFRYNTAEFGSADQFGLFLVDALNHQGIAPNAIVGISVGSVVPSHNWTVKQACVLYLPKARYYELRSDQCNANPLSPIRIKYKNGNEVGSDLVANAIGATSTFPGRNLIIVDMGTATTVCAVTKNKEFLGAAIMPGAKLWAKSLHVSTAQLPHVEVGKNSLLLPIGTSTTLECIQAGIYYGQLGALREIITRTKAQFFKGDSVVVIGTGGYISLYKSEQLVDHVMPELVLQGLLRAYEALGQQDASVGVSSQT